MPQIMPTFPTRDHYFLSFALTEARRAIDHIEEARRLARVRETPQDGVQIFENVAIFDSIRLALHIAAGISRVFWPSGNRERGERLRSLTGLSVDHFLAGRRLRNHIEHLDERIDEVVPLSGAPIPQMWWAFLPHEQGQDYATQAIVTFNRQDESVSILGETYSLGAMQIALQEVLERSGNAISDYYKSLDDA